MKSKWRDGKNMATIWNSSSVVINLREAQHSCVLGIAKEVIALTNQSHIEHHQLVCQDVGSHWTT